MTTFLYTHPACLRHHPGHGHPESPDRLRAILKALEAEEFAALERREAPPIDRKHILRMHPDSHIDFVLEAVPEHGHAGLDGDTIVSDGSDEAALRAAGGVCAAIDAVLSGEARNAFVAVRPPGHHAEPSRAMGFCMFNNVAIGAGYARLEKEGIQRVAVFDWDVHHGNGTQAMFETDPYLFYASTHQLPLYPGTGHSNERGVGNILNVPLRPGAQSEDFRHAVTEHVIPALFDFRPDLILISAGFDAHTDDPLAQVDLVDEDFAWATKQLKRLAKQSCDGKLVSVLEGGYNLNALGRCVAAHVRELMVP